MHMLLLIVRESPRAYRGVIQVRKLAVTHAEPKSGRGTIRKHPRAQYLRAEYYSPFLLLIVTLSLYSISLGAADSLG
jgi:hypothetical protein